MTSTSLFTENKKKVKCSHNNFMSTRCSNVDDIECSNVETYEYNNDLSLTDLCYLVII